MKQWPFMTHDHWSYIKLQAYSRWLSLIGIRFKSRNSPKYLTGVTTEECKSDPSWLATDKNDHLPYKHRMLAFLVCWYIIRFLFLSLIHSVFVYLCIFMHGWATVILSLWRHSISVCFHGHSMATLATSVYLLRYSGRDSFVSILQLLRLILKTAKFKLYLTGKRYTLMVEDLI